MRIDRAAAMVPEAYVVHRRTKETHDTFTLELEAKTGAATAFRAGQFNMLYVFGLGEVPISMSGDPSRQRLLHTVRSVGKVTEAITRLGRGEVIGVRGPFGSNWPVGEAAGRDIVVVAGGIGMAPLRPVIYTLLAGRKRYGRVALLYGARTPRDLLYQRELKKWRGRLDIDLEVTVDSADASWRGDVGVVTKLIRRATFDPGNATVMICGPEVMMRFTAAELRSRGVEQENIFLSMERNMKCAVGYCGHCQFGPTFICKDGPVFRLDRLEPWLNIREL
jgi:NAD(P)H-flavin reductase